MVSLHRFNPTLVRAVLDGTISARELNALGAANVLAIRTDPGSMHRAGGGLLSGTRAEGDQARTFSYVMSTENPVGHDGDIIRTAGWELDDFIKRKQPLLYNHNLSDANADLPLGRMENVRKGRAAGVGALLGDAVIQRGVSSFNDLVLDQIEAGDLNGFSVGWQTIQARELSPEEKQLHAGKASPWAVVFERSNLIEGSITTVGMDPDAVKVRSMNARLESGRRTGRYTEGAVEQFRSMVPDLQTPRRGFVAMTTQTTNETPPVEATANHGAIFIPDDEPKPTEGQRALTAVEAESALMRVLETQDATLAEAVRNLIGETRERSAVNVQRAEFNALREENDDLRDELRRTQEFVSVLSEVTTGVRMELAEDSDDSGDTAQAISLADMTDEQLLEAEGFASEETDSEGDDAESDEPADEGDEG